MCSKATVSLVLIVFFIAVALAIPTPQKQISQANLEHDNLEGSDGSEDLKGSASYGYGYYGGYGGYGGYGYPYSYSSFGYPSYGYGYYGHSYPYYRHYGGLYGSHYW